MRDHIDGWPELTYRYIEHYAWEPQHLLLTNSRSERADLSQSRIEAVYERLRRQEVPLNYLLNVLLRLAPAALRRECLRPFGVPLSDPGLASLALRTPCDYERIQPDVHLESEGARVFIEVKVNAPLTLSQIQKYIDLHSELNSRNGSKQAYILFLVKSAILTISDVKRSFAHEGARPAIAGLINAEAGDITFGSTSWSLFGQTLAQELERRRGEETESAEILATLIGDFLADLKSRHLLQEQLP